MKSIVCASFQISDSHIRTAVARIDDGPRPLVDVVYADIIDGRPSVYCFDHHLCAAIPFRDKSFARQRTQYPAVQLRDPDLAVLLEHPELN